MAHARFAPGPLGGSVDVPGDKSISHRALMLGGVCGGPVAITGPNRGADVLASRDAMRALGVHVADDGADFVVRGGQLRDPAGPIDARNSGTTARLLMGLCAGHGIVARFDGDASLRRRPMERVARPLRALGAAVETTDGRLPAVVRGIDAPVGGSYALELPSAQLKSAILFACLRASGDVRITGDAHSRDHTERMLRHFGREVVSDGREVLMRPGHMTGADVAVPGDLSAAAFFLGGAAVTPGSDVVVRGVGINPTRTGILDALRSMGADVTLEHERLQSGEPTADIRVRHAPLHAIDLGGDLVIRAIDEIPVLAAIAAFAAGTTRIRDAADLRTKESDRLSAIAALLRACGVDARETRDGLEITGGRPQPARTPIATHDDHRIAMSAAVVAAGAGPLEIDDADCAAVSFPGFAAVWQSAQASAAGR